MGRFDRQIATAKRLIEKNGQSVIWRQITNGVPPSATEPWKPAVTAPVDNPVIICFLPYTTVNSELIRALLGTEVPTGTLTGLMAAVGFAPSKKDVVIRDGKTYTLKSVDPLSPNGQIIMYTLKFEVSDNETLDEPIEALGGAVDALSDVVENLPEEQ